MYAIAGVSGNTGSIVADALLASGKKVRVIVRDAAKGESWRSRGAEVAVATLDDTTALARALEGVTGAYLLVPPNLQSTDPVGENRARIASMTRAASAAKLPHAVVLSSMGAQHADRNGPIRSAHVLEKELGAVVPALTAVRAPFFLENWASSLGMLSQGVLPTFLPASLSVPMAATEDIGKTAAMALVEGGDGRQVIELSGPRSYSANDIAEALARITGKPVQAHEMPLDAVVPTLTGFGISAAIAELFREMYAGLISGHVAWEGGTARTNSGKVTAEQLLRKLLAK